MAQLERELYNNRTCPDKDDSQTSSSLTLRSFLGLFIITGASSLLALFLHVVITLYNHRHDLSSASSSQSSWCGWFAILLKIFHEGDRPNAPQLDEPAVSNANTTADTPWSTPDHHIIENVDSGSDVESVREEDREDFVQGPDPPSFAYMHSERGQ
jgi:ionotropic glutamate receptor